MREAIPGESIVFGGGDPADLQKKYDDLLAKGRVTATTLIEHAASLTPKAVAISEMVGDGYRNITYEEVVDWCKALARTLLDGNFCPVTEEASGKKMRLLGAFMYNRPEYLLTDLAGLYIGAATVSLYEEPREHMIYMINKVEFESIFLQPNYANLLAKLMKEKTIRHIKNFIVTESLDAETEALVKELGVNVYSLSALVEKGRKLKTELPVIPPEHILMLVVTSGSTGYPKGIILTHKALCFMHLGIHPFEITSKDCMAMSAYYAFVSTKGLSLVFLTHGGRLVFYPHEKPLFYYSQPERNFDLLKRANPTKLFVTPMYLHAGHEYILDIIRKMPEKEGQELREAIEQKVRLMKDRHEFHFPDVDKLIAPLREKLYGPSLRNVYYIGAKVREDTLWFFRAVLGCPLQSTYGQTELACIGSTDSPFGGFGRIGCAQSGLLVKIVDCEEQGYTTRDVVNGKLAPRGELCIKSPTSFVGFYNEPDKFKDAYMPGGWLRTKDLVQLNLEDMSMQIIGRANEVGKITSVDYIPVEILERTYETSPFVYQIYVHAAYDKDYLVGVVVPKKDAVLQWGKAKGLSGDFEELCKNPELNKMIIEDMAAVANKAKVNSYEYIIKAVITPKPFSTDPTMVTFSGKIRRAGICAKFQEELNALFKK